MKKFISALSSLVLAATAMGGSLAIGSDAATNVAVDDTIISFLSDGKAETEAKAGDTVPVGIYIPQSNGFYSLSLKFSINGNETLGQGKMALAKENQFSTENWEHAFGNYGITIDPSSVDWQEDEESDFGGNNALESGYGFGQGWAAGNLTMESFTMFTPNAFYAGYIGGSDMDKGMNCDALGPYDAAGRPNVKTYTPVTTWTKDEDWAYNFAFVTFDLVLPEDLPDGKYVIDIYRDQYYLNTPSANFNDNGTEKPDVTPDPDPEPDGTIDWTKKTPEKGKGQTTILGFDDAGVEVEKSYRSEPLTITVGDADANETTTKAPGTTTAAPATTTNAPGTTNGGTTPNDPTDAIIYNLIPEGKEYSTNGEGRNVYYATAGEKLTVNWTVKNDLGTAGLQMFLDFSQIEVGEKDQGSAYRVGATTQDANINTVLPNDPENSGLFAFVFGGQREYKANDDAIIYYFEVTVPEEDGTYTIDLKPNSGETVNKVVPADDGIIHPYVFHGLDIVVGQTQETTTTPADGTTTTAPTTTTNAPGTTTTAPTTTTQAPGTTTTVGGQPGDILWGDVNVDQQVRINDVVLLNKHIVKDAEISDQGKLNADCEYDGKLDAKDALKIKQYLAQMIDYSELGNQ